MAAIHLHVLRTWGLYYPHGSLRCALLRITKPPRPQALQSPQGPRAGFSAML